MKKILVVLNGILTPEHVITTGFQLAQPKSSLLHAVFLNYSLQLSEDNYPFPNDLSLTRNYVTGKTIAEENAELLENNIQLFKDECQSAKVDFYIEPGNEISLGQINELSIFSDFILADANKNLSQFHIADLLVDTHCPVYLVSNDVEQIKNIVFTYDGSISNMHAIKMYTYLFPESKNLPVILVHITPAKDDRLPQEEDIKKWLSIHYSNVQIKILQGDIRDELVGYTKSIPDSLTIMGSFGRSAVSRLFHKSLANAIIEDGKSSLFITHK